jgi:hypothetical protein
MEEYITFGEALRYCFTLTSYLVWVFIGVLVLSAGITYNVKVVGPTHGWNFGRKFYVLLGCILFFILTIIYRPSEISANTTKEQAARGVYIGF